MSENKAKFIRGFWHDPVTGKSRPIPSADENGMQILKMLLQHAVEEEDYEKAAELRDIIEEKKGDRDE